MERLKYDHIKWRITNTSDNIKRLSLYKKVVFPFSQIEDNLPRPSGTYLKIILGSVNVSILDKVKFLKANLPKGPKKLVLFIF